MDLFKFNLLFDDLVMNRADMLEATLDLTVYVVFFEYILKVFLDIIDIRVRFTPVLFNFFCKFFINLRIQVAERQIFQLALEPADTKPVCQRGINVSRLLGNFPAPFFILVSQSTHIVQAVSKLDQNHPDIARHSEQHLAEIFSLTFFAGFKGDFTYFGDTIHHFEDFLTEQAANLFFGRQGIFEGVVQQAGNNRRHIHAESRQDKGNLHGMGHVGIAGKTCLPLMNLGRIHVGLTHGIEICIGVVSPYSLKDVVKTNHGRQLTNRCTQK